MSDSAPSSPRIGDLVWHIHHDMLCEPLTEPFETRVAYIKSQKLAIEVPTRLRLMKPVRGKLPELDKASAELVKARAELVKASAEWDKACAELDKARADTAIHADICPDCPWDGHTIFPVTP